MKKALTIATIATLAMSSEFEGFSENELNVFKSIGNGLKKAGEFVVKHPKIITTAAKIIFLDEQADENLSTLLEFNQLLTTTALPTTEAKVTKFGIHDDGAEVMKKIQVQPTGVKVVNKNVDLSELIRKALEAAQKANQNSTQSDEDDFEKVPKIKGIISFDDNDNELYSDAMEQLGELINEAQAEEGEQSEGHHHSHGRDHHHHHHSHHQPRYQPYNSQTNMLRVPRRY